MLDINAISIGAHAAGAFALVPALCCILTEPHQLDQTHLQSLYQLSVAAGHQLLEDLCKEAARGRSAAVREAVWRQSRLAAAAATHCALQHPGACRAASGRSPLILRRFERLRQPVLSHQPAAMQSLGFGSRAAVVIDASCIAFIDYQRQQERWPQVHAA